MCFAPQRRPLFRHLNFQKWSENGVVCTFWLGNVLRTTSACTFSTSLLPKVVWEWCVLYILTWKWASRHNGVHFFDISTSKSAPNLVCLVHFDLEMCFAPQPRALFRHLYFQKWSENGVSCTFWLGNGLRATTACTFSTSLLPKVLRTWCVLYILTWKCASRHNRVHFFDISTSKSRPNMRCFVHFDFQMCSSGQMAPHPPLYSSEPTFRPSGATNHWKKTMFHDFPIYLFAHLHLLSSDSLASDLLSSSLLFSSLTLPTSAFPSVHIVGSLTSKLPSINEW